MRIALIALGSRGDVQPYVALAKGLAAAGHDVRVVTHADFQRLVEAHGLAYRPAGGSIEGVIQSGDFGALLEQGRLLALMRETGAQARKAVHEWTRDGLAAARDADLLIAGMGGLFVALGLAEKLALPLMRAFLVPASPTRAFPGVFIPPGFPSIGPLNAASHHLTWQVMWQSLRAADKAARQEVLALPPAPIWGPFRSPRLRRGPLLYGFSPAVVPPPNDWGPDVHVTGYWFLDQEETWTPPAELVAFLEQEPRPIYVGFGSMANRDPEATTALIVEAVAEAGQRAVLLSGWGELRQDNLPEKVFMARSIPHAWLFPQVAAVVHHGGAGTTAAGLRAGAPSVIVPFFGDQPFWGRRVSDLGAGPEPIPRRRLTAARLARAIEQAVGDDAMRARASEVGRQIRAEDGVARAVEVIERDLSGL